MNRTASFALLIAAIPAGFLIAQQAAAPSLTADMFKSLDVRNLGGIQSSGRIADIAVDPKNRNIWYIATASGGLWKTTNRGLTFQPIFEKGGSYSLGCVTVDPKDPNVVWLGTGENQAQRAIGFGDGVYKSTDAGATWKNVGLPNSEHIAKIVIDPRNSNTVFVASQGPLYSNGGDRGVYKTTDGGQTWKQSLAISQYTGATDLDYDPRNPDVMYAASYQRQRHTSLIIAGGPESAIYKSTDAGAHWAKLTEGLPTVDIGRIAIAVSPQKPDTVYSVISLAHNNSYFYRSDDAGAHWTKTYDLIGRNQLQDPEYYGEIMPDPSAYDRVYIMDTTVRLTTDGGKTITPAGFQVHSDNHALVFDPTDPNHLLEGNDGGLYESYDKGKSWRHYNAIPVTQFYRVSVDYGLPFYNIYGGAQDNGSQGTPSRSINRAGIRTSDWMTTGGGDGFPSRADYADPDTVYTCSQQINCIRLDLKTGISTPIRPQVPGMGGRGGGGGGRGAAGRGAQDAQPPAGSAANDSAAARGGAGAGAGAGSEENASCPQNGFRDRWDLPFIISPFNHTRLYIFSNHLLKSEDRGETWKLMPGGDLTKDLDRENIAVMGKERWGPEAVNKNLFTDCFGTGTSMAESPLKEGLIVLGTDDGLVQITEDGGNTWRKIDRFPGVPDLAYVTHVLPSPTDLNTIFVTFNHFQFGDYKAYVLKSTDLGRTWKSIAGDLPMRDPVWTIAQDYVDPNLLFVGTEFGMSFSIDGGSHWVKFKGMPTISIRDFDIQKRENDLVAASFGRGFFVLDDYSALRHLTPEALSQEAALFPVGRPARSFDELGYYRAGGDNVADPNPPFGALLTYFVKDAISGDAKLVLTVTDSKGAQVRELDASGTPGLHRTPWDLREQAAQGGGGNGRGNGGRGGQPPAGAGDQAGAARGGGRGGRGGRGGPLVSVGTYKVQLGKSVNGTVTPIGEPQTVQVVPLEASNR
jgi:photosystem II stability/assembly factor-like uncharacterized protein